MSRRNFRVFAAITASTFATVPAVKAAGHMGTAWNRNVTARFQRDGICECDSAISHDRHPSVV
jgi:hypothetical protein